MMRDQNKSVYPGVGTSHILRDIQETLALAEIERAAHGDIGGRLRALIEDGVIHEKQASMMMLSDPRRSCVEITLIEALAEKGAICADSDALFEEVQQAGSQYFFENFSPMAHILGTPAADI